MFATLGAMHREDNRRSLRQTSSIWRYRLVVIVCVATDVTGGNYWAAPVTYSHRNRAVEAIRTAESTTFARLGEIGEGVLETCST
jgi:hypothetical protein